MSTQLVRQEEMGIQSLNELGGIFVKSGYFKDVKEAAQAAVKIMYGRELGFSPVIAMTGIHIIEGKPALSANLMGAMIKRSGRYDYRVAELNDTNCILVFIENGNEVGVSGFSMADAKRAGVIRSGGSWEKYPRNMMFARALSNGLKLYCPDLSMCPIYNPEELGAEVSEEGAVISHPVTAPATIDAPKTFGAPKKLETLPPLEDLVASAKAAEAQRQPEIIEEVVDYIEHGQQVNFATNFREALPAEHKPAAEKLRHEWLKMRGYVGADGEPTAKRIPKRDFVVARQMACNWAKEYVNEVSAL